MSQIHDSVPAADSAAVGLPGPAHVWVVNGFLATFAAALVVLAVNSPEIFNRWMHEDAWGEWATFFAFLLGGVIGLAHLVNRLRNPLDERRELVHRLTILALSLICLFVAGEEISWGQRLFGIMPPELFQKYNHQQELNLHNILVYFVSARFVIMLICFGYGVALPVVVRICAPSASTRQLSILHAIAPPIQWSAWFALTGLVYWIDPIPLAPEAAELMLGLLLLSVIGIKCLSVRSLPVAWFSQATWAVMLLGLPLILGAISNPLLDRYVHLASEDLISQTRRALKQIASDLDDAGSIYSEIPKQGRVIDSRIYECVRQELVRFSDESRFYGTRDDSALSSDERLRRTYFLDPWNNPYWIGINGEGPVRLYSFGPNRRLDTIVLHEDRLPARFESQGDDISIWVDLFADSW